MVSFCSALFSCPSLARPATAGHSGTRPPGCCGHPTVSSGAPAHPLHPAPARFQVERLGLAPLRYADDGGRPTGEYPFCPNGSPGGVAALCSPDGRHLAMMPHPERCFLKWQWPYCPEPVRSAGPGDAAPWLFLFQNARRFCDATSAKAPL